MKISATVATIRFKLVIYICHSWLLLSGKKYSVGTKFNTLCVCVWGGGDPSGRTV